MLPKLPGGLAFDILLIKLCAFTAVVSNCKFEFVITLPADKEFTIILTGVGLRFSISF